MAGVGVVEAEVGEDVCGVAGACDTWEGVEGAFGDDAIDAWELIEAGDDKIPAGAELGEHSVYAVLRAGEGLEAGVLGGRVGAGVRVDLELSYLFCEGLWHHAIAEAPACHRVGLGEAVEDDGALIGAEVRLGGDAGEGAIVEHAGVDLVA